MEYLAELVTPEMVQVPNENLVWRPLGALEIKIRFEYVDQQYSHTYIQYLEQKLHVHRIHGLEE